MADVTTNNAANVALYDETGTRVGTPSNPLRVDPTGTTPQPVIQSGAWLVGAAQSGAWAIGRTWALAAGTDAVAAVQSGSWTVDVSDKDARLLGRAKLLNSGGVVIDPATDRTTAVAPFATRLSDGAGFYDARQIRALTSADVVDVSDRDARLLGRAKLLTSAGVVIDPATDRTTAAAPFSVRLSDGAAFIGGTNAAPLYARQQRGANCAQATVAASATNVTLLTSNANRLRYTIVNDSALAILYVRESATAASATAYTYRLEPGDQLSVNDYTGQVNGIWSVASGNARTSELTV